MGICVCEREGGGGPGLVSYGVYRPTTPVHDPVKPSRVSMAVPLARRSAAHVSLEQRPKACRVAGVFSIQWM